MDTIKLNNRFNMIYKDLSADEIQIVNDIKQKARDMADEFMKCPRTHEMVIAMTNLEQAVMWAVKAVCINHVSE